MSILVITTGGTIGALPEDPVTPPKFSTMPEAGRDTVQEALASSFSAFNARCISFELRDSKLIDEAYRERLLTVVKEAPEKRILITHGTDALLKTADFFYAKSAEGILAGKTVLITGAMMPLANGPQSDGYENLAFALETLANPPEDLAKTSIVLSDFDAKGEWSPRLYVYVPHTYEKLYDVDRRFSRLKRIPE